MGRYLLRRVIAAIAGSLVLAVVWAVVHMVSGPSPLPGRSPQPRPSLKAGSPPPQCYYADRCYASDGRWYDCSGFPVGVAGQTAC